MGLPAVLLPINRLPEMGNILSSTGASCIPMPIPERDQEILISDFICKFEGGGSIRVGCLSTWRHSEHILIIMKFGESCGWPWSQKSRKLNKCLKAIDAALHQNGATNLPKPVKK